MSFFKVHRLLSGKKNINTCNAGELERFFDHPHLSGPVVRQIGRFTRFVVAVVHVVSPYVLPQTRQVIVELGNPLVQAIIRRRHRHRSLGLISHEWNQRV